jgi:hypothetical protein
VSSGTSATGPAAHRKRPAPLGRRIIRSGKPATPGKFRTHVITDGVISSPHADCKHSKIKMYLKEGKALRTETAINDTRNFGIGKRLTQTPTARALPEPAAPTPPFSTASPGKPALLPDPQPCSR